MSQSAVSGYLPCLLGPVAIKNNGVVVPARAGINFLGCAFSDDGSNIIITPNASYGLIGDASGYAQITAANGTIVTTTKGKDTDFFFAATTPNATAATMFTYTPLSGRIISIDGIIKLYNGGAGYAKYKLDGLYTTTGGVLTKRSTTPADVATGPESSASTAVALTLSGGNIVVTGAGFSASNSWTGRIFISEASF